MSPSSNSSAKAVVFDCSALASYLLDEPSLTRAVTEAVEGAWEIEAKAPALLAWEFTNVLAVGLSTGRLDEEEAAEAARLFAEFPVELVEPRREDTLRHAKQAAQRGLSAYDASYLLLAEKLGGPLVTLDDGLARAAAEAGLRTIPQR